MFTKIDEMLWTDLKYKELSDDGKFLFIYVLSCPHRNMLGFYFLPIPYGAFDLGWDGNKFEKALKELVDYKFISYNFETNIIFIKNFLKYNPLNNPNQVIGAVKALQIVPKDAIDIELLEVLVEIKDVKLNPLIQELNVRVEKGLVKGFERIPKGYEKQEEEEVDVDVDVKEDKESDKTIVAVATSPTEKYNMFFNTYNEQGIIKHRKLTKRMKQAIDQELKKESQENLLKAIERYGTAYRDKSYKYSQFEMTLDKFLKQSNGYYDWLDEGQKWINYNNFKDSGGSHESDKTTTKHGREKSEGDNRAEQAGVTSF